MFKKYNWLVNLRDKIIKQHTIYNYVHRTNFGTGGYKVKTYHNNLVRAYNCYKYFWMDKLDEID